MKNLKRYTSRNGKVDFFYSPEIEREMTSGAGFNEYVFEKVIIPETLKKFVDDKSYRRLIELNSRLLGLDKKIGILEAHGGTSENGVWAYNSGGMDFSVQRFIDRFDGEYSAIILRTCNPDSLEICSKGSAIIAPNRTYSETSQNIGDVQVELYLPKIGYLDSYILEAVEKEMAETLRARKKIVLNP